MPKPSAARVRAILEELYALDPSLRTHGPALEQMVATLIAAQPDTQINPAFAAQLRKTLAATAAPSPSPLTMINQSFTRIWIPSLTLTAAVLLVAVVITQPQLFGLSRNQTAQEPTIGDVPSQTLSISHVSKNAFGELFAAAGGYGGDAAISARPQSGGGGAPVAAPQPPTEDVAENSTKLYAPEDFVYERPRYQYGDALPELSATGDVYRRAKATIGGLNNALSNANLGFLNLSQFNNLKLTQFSVTEPGPYGYIIYVDVNEGTASINQDWMTWPQTLNTPCPADGECGYEGLTPADIPEDTALITIANDFLKKYNINTSNYAAPIVDRRWSVAQPYMRDTEVVTEDLKIRWAPDVVNLIYPLELDGVQAYDQSGFPYGLTVSINVRERKVSGVWNLTALQYEASSYDLITDEKELKEIASRGDIYAAPFGSPYEQIHDYKLGTPTHVLMQTWHQTDDGRGEELLVPALRFPVIPDADGSSGYRDAVMVPLVSGLFEPIYRTLDGGIEVAPPPTPAVDPAIAY